jgi:TolB-like protein
MTIQASLLPGNYEARAFYDYGRKGYVVSARYPFSVAGGMAPVIPLPAPSTPTVTAALPAPAAESLRPADRTSQKTSSAVIEITVFHFTPRSMDIAKYGLTISETLINAPAIRSNFSVLGRRDLETFLARNNLQQDDQLENIVDIGTRLGLNFVIAGTVEKHGTMIFTSLKVVSVAKGRAVFQKRFVSTGEADMINNVAKIGEDIAEAIRKNAE